MALITDYASLQAHVLDTIRRSDLTTQVKNFIQQFEATARDDFRLRKLIDRGTVTVSSDSVAMPSDYHSLDSWYHDGPVYYGPIFTTSPGEIGRLKTTLGATGVPQYASIVNGRARFAPAADQAYSTKLTYWAKVVNLSDSITSNWLLADHPDIYLYGACLESAPFLKHDTRLVTWSQILEKRIEAFYQTQQDAINSGNMKRRMRQPIG
ncbi:MAG: hypothetical protein AB7R40_23350 [Nitrospiraceae bacterium]